jgi:monothiol glutaredoxin
MPLSPETRDRISALVQSSPVFLFMKGTPDAPQCGFSAQVIQILGRLVPEFGSHDVLSDPEVREGIKEFSDWPTIPQLYVKGEFMGGCDIVLEMYENGELQDALGVPRPSAEPPKLEISPAAAELLRGAKEKSGGADLHLTIDARYQSQLGLGPAEPGQLSVESGGVTVYMDGDTAARAQGVVIDAEDAKLTIHNPNAPEQPA